METVNSKVLVFGEYSVLYNSMALTIPFSKFSGTLCYPKNSDESSIAVLSNKGIREFCKHILENHTDTTFKLNVTKMSKELDKGLFFRSDIPHMTGQNNFTNRTELQERIVIPYTFNLKNLGKNSRGRHYGI